MGKHSIRINDQWRIVFRWTDAGPEDVEIIDYHQEFAHGKESFRRFIPAKSCGKNFLFRLS
jgi:hypothetical protein